MHQVHTYRNEDALMRKFQLLVDWKCSHGSSLYGSERVNTIDTWSEQKITEYQFAKCDNVILLYQCCGPHAKERGDFTFDFLRLWPTFFCQISAYGVLKNVSPG